MSERHDRDRSDEQRRVAELLRSFDAPAPESLHRRVEALVAAHEGPARRARRSAPRADHGSAARASRRRPFSAWGFAAAGVAAIAVVAVALVVGLQRRLPHAEPAPGRRADPARRDAARAGGEPGGPRPAHRRGRRREVPLLGRALRLAQHRDAQRSDRRARGHDGLLCQRRRPADRLRDPRRDPRAANQRRQVAWHGGVPYRLFTENGAAVVTWQRDGHLCVMSGHGVSSATLLRLASWSDREASTS